MLALPLWSQTTGETKKVYEFAEYLFEEGDYARASSEYYRYGFLMKPELSDSILFKIAICYGMDKQWEPSAKVFKHLIRNYPSSEWTGKAFYNAAFIQSTKGNLNRSYQLLDSALLLDQYRQMRFEYMSLQAYNSLKERNYIHALNVTNEIDSESSDRIRIVAEQGVNLKLKNPFLAGTLSAVIPGSGKWYTGRVQDGVYSFVLVGMSTWQAYSGFHDKGIESIKGWIYASLGTVFYLGNIHGSVVSAKLYNQKQHNTLIQKLELNFKF